jgi:hypothetical protein
MNATVVAPYYLPEKSQYHTFSTIEQCQAWKSNGFGASVPIGRNTWNTTRPFCVMFLAMPSFLLPQRNFPAMGGIGAMDPDPFVLRPD